MPNSIKVKTIHKIKAAKNFKTLITFKNIYGQKIPVLKNDYTK